MDASTEKRAHDAAKPFVHLRVHSAYSLLEGALTVAKLAELARADHMPALALTDSNNLFGALEFSEGLAETGVQPIIGCTLSLTFGTGEGDPVGQARGPRADGRLALLAKDEQSAWPPRLPQPVRLTLRERDGHHDEQPADDQQPRRCIEPPSLGS